MAKLLLICASLAFCNIPWYDYIGRKDPVTGEITCPWRKGRGKVQSGGSSGVQMAG